MKNLILNEKKLRKKMIDLDIKTINEYINGKSPLSAAFVRLCNYLNVDPHEILIETETASKED